MASELSKFIDDELAKVEHREEPDTEALLKDKERDGRREALRVELQTGRKRSHPGCDVRVWLTALLVIGVLLLVSVWVTGRRGPSDVGEEMTNPSNMFAPGSDDYDYDYDYDYGKGETADAYYGDDYEDGGDGVGGDYDYGDGDLMDYGDGYR